VEHEPRGFLGHAKRAVQLVGANPVLAIGEHPQRRKPLVETERRILEDRSDFDGELLAAGAALPDPTRRQKHRGNGAAVYTHGAVRPAKLGDERKRAVRVREVDNRLGQGLRCRSSFVHGLNLRSGLGCVKYVIARECLGGERKPLKGCPDCCGTALEGTGLRREVIALRQQIAAFTQAHAVGDRAAATLPDSKRIDEMETFVRWAAATYPDVIKGVLINGTPDGDISVTVLGPDDCFTARDLRQALDDATLASTVAA
jgi:hypothetical protein